MNKEKKTSERLEDYYQKWLYDDVSKITLTNLGLNNLNLEDQIALVRLVIGYQEQSEISEDKATEILLAKLHINIRRLNIIVKTIRNATTDRDKKF